MSTALRGLGAETLDEVVFGYTFAPMHGLTAAHAGLLWLQVAEELPGLEEKPPIVVATTTAQSVDLWQVRQWFVSADGRRLLQVQRDRVHFNWRRRAPDDVYPGFEALYAEFCRHWQTFCQMLGEFGFTLEISGAELQYINVVPVANAEIADANVVLPGLRLPVPPYLSVTTGFAHVVEGESPQDAGVRLRVGVQTAQRVTDKAPMLRLELTGSAIMGGEFDVGWHRRAHGVILESYHGVSRPGGGRAVGGEP